MSTEFKFQASVKDADGDMVNVRADSPEELAAYLSSFPVAEYAQFKANVRGGAALGGIVQPAPQAPPQQHPPLAPAAPQAQGWPGQAPQQAPVQQGPRTHPEGKQCSMCGSVLAYKEVNRKSDGKQFKFWACPNQRNRDDGHQTEFAN